jgi:histidinol phosphatase-like PHP family hydrolase
MFFMGGALKQKSRGITNSAIAEWLALQAEEAKTPMLTKAFRRASRRAFGWPEEVSAILERGGSLTELQAIGPYLARKVEEFVRGPVVAVKPSPLRKNFQTISEARGLLAKKPSWLKDYKGDLQMHTTWSDGSAAVREMANAAMDRRYEYIAITDHTKGLKIAGGIDEEALRQQGEEIDALNVELRASGKKFRVLKSAELNINPAGESDTDASALRRLDIVVGSFHSALRKTEDQTDRYVAALKNPDFDILGHPRGRIYNYRLGLKADWKKVFATAARFDKAVEIDSYPDRQDLDVGLLKIAKLEGCKIAIDTDAHHPEQLAFVELGLGAAIKAGILPENIVNFRPVEELLAWVKKRRELHRKRRSG